MCARTAGRPAARFKGVISIMRNSFLFTVLVLLSSHTHAFEFCSDDIIPLEYGESKRFSLEKSSDHTDWVKVRMMISKSGKAGDVKPIEYSSDLYINRTPKRVREILFKKPDETCWKDLYLYQTIKRNEKSL